MSPPITPALCAEALRLLKEHGTLHKAAKASGIPSGTLRNRVLRAPAVGVTESKVLVPETKLAPEAVLRVLRTGDVSLKDLAARVGATKGQALDLVENLRESGYSIYQHGDVYHLDRLPQTSVAGGRPMLEYLSDEDGNYHFGACGDTHLGSKYARLDVLNDLYRRYAELGVDRVFHTGNWIDGERRFNKHDLLVHGLGPQVRYLVEKYPRVGGLTTFAVAGDDHEGWYAQDMGLDIGRFAETAMRDAGREDWVNLGYIEADVALVHAKTGERSILRVAHPGGGSAYATSYTSQKYVESLEGGDKPAVVLLGHYHKGELLLTRNVWTIQTMCTQDQTPFARKKRLEFAVGGVAVRLRQAEDGSISECDVKFMRYFNRGYYSDRNGRWNHDGPVNLPARG